MSSIIALTIVVLAWHGAMALARLMVDVIVTAMGFALFARAAHVRRRILALREKCGSPDFDQRPSRAARRLMASGLKLAIRQTEFRSLLPHVGSRCDRLLSTAAPSL